MSFNESSQCIVPNLPGIMNLYFEFRMERKNQMRYYSAHDANSNFDTLAFTFVNIYQSFRPITLPKYILTNQWAA